ncbi:MAG: TraB/GumN family protein [Gammaproteobacteria bacterium]|nr:TraB/GumN family protein [Gammaproteobacteria bacterium]
MRWLFLFVMLCSSAAFAETSLWRVSKGDHSLFIGGTIHVLRETDYPLPAAFDKAFAAATTLIFETDVAATEDPVFAQQMMQRLMYTDGRSLQDGLSPAVYRQLEKFCAERGVPIVMFQQMRPPAAALTLMMMELQRLGISNAGVDSHYYQRAQAEHKIIGELETPAEQLEFLAGLGEGREDDFVRYSLKDMQQLETVMRDLTEAWRTGDQAKMAQLSLDELRREFPLIYRQLLVERNNNWVPRIEALLNDPATELVLVGALHLVGNEGVLALLRQRGYKIEQW